MNSFRSKLFLLAVFWMLICDATPVMAIEGMTTGAEHSAVKAIIQTDYATAPQLEESMATLRGLIAVNEAQFGKNSRQVGILLCDIGEAAFKQASTLEGTQKADKYRRAVGALVSGADMLKPYQGEGDGYIIQRARAYRFAGMAYLALGDKKDAEAALRNGLAIHWKRFNDSAYQLDFFPTLFDAVDGSEAKRKVAEAEIKIARNVYNVPTGSGHVSLEGPLKRLRIAETEGNPKIAQFDAARVKAASLAAQGDNNGSYSEMATAFALAANDSDRRLYIGHLKPSPFFVYNDPDAAKREGWESYQGELKMDAYDHVATRFFVDHNLMPFIEEGRNNLMALLAQWEAIYLSGDTEKAAYFCRLIPGNYTGYSGFDLPGFDRSQPLIPPFCANSVEWAGWMRMQGITGQGVRYLEMGMALLPPSAAETAAGKKFLIDSLTQMSAFEAYYGSPDSFLSAFERLSNIDQAPSAEFAFYAAIIRDQPEAFLSALKTLGAAGLRQGSDEEGPGPVSKLAIVGPKIGATICANQPNELPAIVRASFCPEDTGLNVEQINAEMVSMVDQKTAMQRRPFVAVPDWRLLKLLDRPEFARLRPVAKSLFSPGETSAFTDRKLSNREQGFLKRPRDYDTYLRQTPPNARIDDQLSDDFDAAYLSTALYEAGKLDMAKSWAGAAIDRYQSASPPQTIFSLWLSDVYEEQTYLDGWRWLFMEKPLLASAAFSKHIPKDLSYSRGGVGQETQSSLNWERVTGAYHGRIIADEKLNDQAAARQDARALVAYLRFVLGLQSFSRNETREVIVRVARPALTEALRALAQEKTLSADDQEAVFQIVQMMKPSGTGATVARLGARLAAVSPELALLAKRREELRQKWLLMPAEQQDDRRALAVTIDELDTDLARKFPRYVEISGTVAVSIVETAKDLTDKEALVAFLDTGENYLVVAVTQSETIVATTTMPSEDINRLVHELRRGLELRGGRVPAFRAGAALDLYRQLFAPIEAVWKKNPDHLILVPDSALESIPFAVLLTDEPSSDDFASYKWLADKYIVTRVPSIGSLTMLRGGSHAKMGDLPFLGVGDPILDGDPDTERGGLAATKVAALRGGANVADIRALPRLPETADELRALQRTFNAPEESLLLGENATEAAVKAEDLAQFKILAFATHGLLAGEITGQEEAGLIMTPPVKATAVDDGYLSASDVAALNLNADVVLLSACNTAAPEQVGAEGLSGLAKAFFFAGARNLVVSHWAVDSLATASLTEAMFENKIARPSGSYASALRDAMRQIRNRDGGKFAHPLYWGAFEVVGAD